MTLATLTTVAVLAPATTVAAAPTTTTDAAEAAAGWLAGRLVDGERLQTEFDGQAYDDAGLTADAVLALAGVGVAAEHIASATAWLETQAEAYAGDGVDAAWAGATAKLLLVADVTGEDATDFGGLDLVTRLEEREVDTGDHTGRFVDSSEFGDFSNVITQSLAIVALERATDTGASEAAVDYLVRQACDDGGFPLVLDAETCTSTADGTGFAVQALVAAGATAAAGAAGDWLVATQADGGSFGGAEAASEANSTGLAGAALALLGHEEEAAAARGFLTRLQQGCDDAHPGAIPFSTEDAGDVQRATAQALVGLAAVDLATVTAAGASTDVPTFDCPARFSDVAYGENVHTSAINELVRREVVVGREDGTYRPAAALGRGQLATFLGRAMGIEPSDGTRFSDVEGTTHAGYINALADRGIVAGYEDGTYRPNEPVGRDQIASVLARWLELEPVEEDAFSDIAGNPHRQAINALAGIDVARGTTDGRYLPGLSLQRDQAASLLVRALEWAEARDAQA
ncbi:MAG: S-layer homology domain-containing protein [Actinobacteria bacterium]|nr:S-layer homology domain-containing protein [Actinomycetota bacterium]